MHGIFVAHGPFSTTAKEQYHASRHVGWHQVSDDAHIIETFQNVEIYNLVMKLLGISSADTHRDGIPGFWVKYLPVSAADDEIRHS